MTFPQAILDLAAASQFTPEQVAAAVRALAVEDVQLRWNLEKQRWEARAIIATADTLAELDEAYPDSTAYKPGTGWPLDADHPQVIAAQAATNEYDALHQMRKNRAAART